MSKSGHNRVGMAQTRIPLVVELRRLEIDSKFREKFSNFGQSVEGGLGLIGNILRRDGRNTGIGRGMDHGELGQYGLLIGL